MCGHSNERCIEQCLDVVLFIILHEVVLTFESVVKSFCVITLMKAVKLYVCDNLCIIKRFVYIFLILTLSFRDLNFFSFCLFRLSRLN